MAPGNHASAHNSRVSILSQDVPDAPANSFDAEATRGFQISVVESGERTRRYRRLPYDCNNPHKIFVKPCKQVTFLTFSQLLKGDSLFDTRNPLLTTSRPAYTSKRFTGGGGRGGGFGGVGGTGKRYNLTFTISARNEFNHVNFGTPNGVLTSPFFGESTTLAGAGGGMFGGAGTAAGNRRVELQLRFQF
jgi:hypothetical protein